MTREEINEEKQQEIINLERKEKITKIIKLIIKFLIFITIFFSLFFTYTTYISTIKVEVHEYRIKNKKIPNSFNGLKIIHFSDLHYGSTMYLENIKKIVTQINERKPDLIVFTGDLINKDYKISSKEQEKLINELKKLNASLGKYAITGEEDAENFTTIFNQSDFIILKNEYDLIYKENNDPILLIGLSSSLQKEQNIEQAYSYFTQEVYNSNIYTITLLHEPDEVDDILNNYNTDLFLAGHSHNGNIQIPFINYPLFKYEGAKKYNQEFYQLNNAKLYISSGLGTPSGIRLFCRPSINFFRLSSE